MTKVISLVVFLSVGTSFAQPYVPQVIWDRSGQTDRSAYGYRILPLGDQNDDGFADWAINSGLDAGRALEFYHGASPLPIDPYHLFYLDTSVYLGFGADIVGDINGDGYQDWLLSETRSVGYDAAIFLGGPITSDTPRVVFYRPDYVRVLPFAGVFGQGSGDFNGDGYDDVFEYDFNSDVARIFYGGDPMDTLPDWTLYEPPPGIVQSRPYATGDFNGDGASDFMCFQSGNGNIAIFLGGTIPDTLHDYYWSGMTAPKVGLDSLNGDIADEFVRGGPSPLVHFGRPELSPIPDAALNSIAPVYAADGGDFNGDGYHDLILYTWSTLDNPFGALDLHLGHPWLNPDPVFTIEGDTPPYYLRGIYTAAGLGDVNGDGLGDIAVGVWNETFWRRGRCVILGGDTLRVSANPARPELPNAITIEVYPNPFNSETTVKLTLPWSERLNAMVIYNSLGQVVRQEVLPPFVSQVSYQFEARDLPSGSYFLQVRSGTLEQTQKLILVR